MRDLRELEKYRLTDKEIQAYGVHGDSGNGAFKIFVSGKSFFVIASNGNGWEHISISRCNRKLKCCPTWEEMCAIKDMFFTPEECAVQYHPPRSEYINNHLYCLHIWRPTACEMPRPPKWMV